ncbi:MAG: YfiR family protein [Rickettsiales bacterium]|nr:YfiR family protein [Rickettsiales bacterium]
MLTVIAKYRRLKITIAALTTMLAAFNANAMEDGEVQAYAGFIQELINTTTMVKQGVTCTFGSDEIANAIVAQEAKSINLAKNPEKFAQCKAIYVSKGSEKILKSEIARFSRNKIMTVAIFDGFAETGGMVQVQMGRRNFEITLNSKEAKASGVRLNALLLSLVIN